MSPDLMSPDLMSPDLMPAEPPSSTVIVPVRQVWAPWTGPTRDYQEQSPHQQSHLIQPHHER